MNPDKMEPRPKLSALQIVTVAGFTSLLLFTFYLPEFGAYMDATPVLKWSLILVLIPFILVKAFPGIEHYRIGNDTLAPSQYSDGSKPPTDYAVANALIHTFVDMKPKMQRDCPICSTKVVEGEVPENCSLKKGCARADLDGRNKP